MSVRAEGRPEVQNQKEAQRGLTAERRAVRPPLEQNTFLCYFLSSEHEVEYFCNKYTTSETLTSISCAMLS